VFDLLGAERVLAVQPHYDDNDIAAAGTLCRIARAGAHVAYLTVSDDLLGVLDPDLDDDAATQRLRAEQHAAGEIVGVSEQAWLGWPDAGGIDHVALRDQVVAAIRETRPDVVMTCDPWLPYEVHQDHVRTGHAVLEAALLSGLLRLRSGGRPHRVDHVALYYAGTPNVVIDTTDVQSERHAALDQYRMQFDDDGLAQLHRVLDKLESTQAPGGATHGESFRVMPASALHCGVRPASPLTG
jgi:LmbE family N-acetylglucosaminyl deacetylase